MKKLLFLLVFLPTVLAGRDYYSEAETLYYAGKFPEAISVALEGVGQEGLEESAAVELYSILGSSYARLGAFDKAAEYMVRCYEYDKAAGEREGLTSSLINLASMYVYAGRPELAEDYALEAISNEESVGRPAKLAMALGKACDVYHALGRDSLALTYADRAVTIAREQLGAVDVAVRRSQRAYALEALGRYDEALADMRFAEQQFRDAGAVQSLSVVCFQLAQEYGRTGRTALERQYLRESASLCRELHDMPLLQKVLSRLAASLRKDSPSEAFAVLEEATALQDSISRSKSEHTLELYNIEYETARREETIRSQQAELGRQRRLRNILILAALLLLAGAAATTFLSIRARRGEKALRQSNSQKDFLLRVISHDIYSPTAARRKGLQMLRRGVGRLSAEELQDIFLKMENQADAEIELLDNVLRWSRSSGSEETVRFDLRSLASEVVKQYGQAASLKNVSLVLDGPAVIVRSDRSCLMLALRNLVSNAIKFSPSGASVRIEVALGEGTATVGVTDSGIGIPADRLEEIFRPDGAFRRAGTAGEISNGLGLAVSRSLVESLGGRITVQSTPGQGSVFTIIIPSSDND